MMRRDEDPANAEVNILPEAVLSTTRRRFNESLLYVTQWKDRDFKQRLVSASVQDPQSVCLPVRNPQN